MPAWRALRVRRANSLAIAEQSPNPEWLLLRVAGREVAAVPVLRRLGALLLGILAGVLSEEELDAGAIAGITEAWPRSQQAATQAWEKGRPPEGRCRQSSC